MSKAHPMIDLSERYRRKALACEHASKDATEPALKAAWSEIAMEWHALAYRVARVTGADDLTSGQ